LHTAQVMPLPLTVSCFSKIQIGLPFWYRLTRVVLDKGPLNRSLSFTTFAFVVSSSLVFRTSNECGRSAVNVVFVCSLKTMQICSHLPAAFCAIFCHIWNRHLLATSLPVTHFHQCWQNCCREQKTRLLCSSVVYAFTCTNYHIFISCLTK